MELRITAGADDILDFIKKKMDIGIHEWNMELRITADADDILDFI